MGIATFDAPIIEGGVVKQYFIRNEGTSTVYEQETAGIRCRADAYSLRETKGVRWTELRRIEWQANRLSAAILMPKSMVAIMVARYPLKGDFMRQTELAHAMSDKFNVSAEAAYYRLIDLGYIDKEYGLTSQQIFVGDLSAYPASAG